MSFLRPRCHAVERKGFFILRVPRISIKSLVVSQNSQYYSKMRFCSSIQKNNLAVAFICQGNFNDAQKLLTESISLVKKRLDNTITSANPSNNNLGEIGLQSIAILSEPPNQIIHQQSSDWSPLWFFDRVFRIRREDSDNERLICATILYNLAIVFHLASCRGRLSHCHVKKVLTLYKMSGAAVDRPDSSSSEASLLILATHNNLAHINSLYFKGHETHQALEEMVNALKFLDIRKEVGSAHLFVFQLNAYLHSSCQSFRSAPSA